MILVFHLPLICLPSIIFQVCTTSIFQQSVCNEIKHTKTVTKTVLVSVGLQLSGADPNFSNRGGGGPNVRRSIATERRVGMIEYSIVLANCILLTIAHTYSRHFRSKHELIFKQVLA